MVHLLSFVWTIFNIVFRGYLISVFWAWFVMTQFTNLPHLSVIAAIGLSLFIGLVAPKKSLTAKDIDDIRDSKESDLHKYMNLINNVIYTFAYLITWAYGAIVYYLFM